MNIPIWIKSSYVTYIGSPSFLPLGGVALSKREGKPPGSLTFRIWIITHLLTSDNKSFHSDLLAFLTTQLNSDMGTYYSLAEAIVIPIGADLNDYCEFGNYVRRCAILQIRKVREPRRLTLSFRED